MRQGRRGDAIRPVIAAVVAAGKLQTGCTLEQASDKFGAQFLFTLQGVAQQSISVFDGPFGSGQFLAQRSNFALELGQIFLGATKPLLRRLIEGRNVIKIALHYGFAGGLGKRLVD